MFDKVKDMASNAGQYKDMLQGINFPASKDELVAQLQQKGADSGMLDKVKGASKEQFDSPDDVMNAIK